jgi:nucleotide-binding universal stress UspA family protein
MIHYHRRDDQQHAETDDMNPSRILCASHGTNGARAAESQALRLCHQPVSLHHLIIVPDFWKGMMGDDWLNNAITQERYGEYLECLLENEVAEVVERLEKVSEAQGVDYSYETRIGKPTECLLQVSQESDFDLIVIGSPRPKGMQGYHSRMDLKLLSGQLRVPLLIVPYPLAT